MVEAEKHERRQTKHIGSSTDTRLDKRSSCSVSRGSTVLDPCTSDMLRLRGSTVLDPCTSDMSRLTLTGLRSLGRMSGHRQISAMTFIMCTRRLWVASSISLSGCWPLMDAACVYSSRNN